MSDNFEENYQHQSNRDELFNAPKLDKDSANFYAIEHRVCKHCYWIGPPRSVEHGSWPAFIFHSLFIFPFLFVAKCLRVALAYMPVTKWIVPEDDSEWNFFPQAPYKTYGCRQCPHPDSMVPIESREGQDAMFWAKRKEKQEQAYNIDDIKPAYVPKSSGSTNKDEF